MDFWGLIVLGRQMALDPLRYLLPCSDPDPPNEALWLMIVISIYVSHQKYTRRLINIPELSGEEFIASNCSGKWVGV